MFVIFSSRSSTRKTSPDTMLKMFTSKVLCQMEHKYHCLKVQGYKVIFHENESGYFDKKNYHSPAFRNVPSYRYFNLKKEAFIWDTELKLFYPLHGLEVGVSAEYFHKQKGLSKDEQDKR